MMGAALADADVAARMFDARQALETRERARLTLEELGRRIATAEGRPDKPYAAAVVKRWLEGEAEPGAMSTWRAIAYVFDVRVGWLANGELPVRDDGEGGQGARANDNPKPTNGTQTRATPRQVEILSSKYIPTTKEREQMEREEQKRKRRKPGAMRQTG